MPTVFTHAAVAACLASVTPRAIAPARGRLFAAAIACSVLPDLDVVGFAFGIGYGDLLGHRGLSHSLPFALLVGFAASALVHGGRDRIRLWLLLSVVTASHGVLDAFTDGGLGVAFLSPFDPTRSFFAWRPVAVSPIGVEAFFSTWGARVLASELTWIWLPLGAATAAIHVARARLVARRPPE